MRGNQRVIPSDRHQLKQTGIHSLRVVTQRRSLAVQDLAALADLTSKGREDALLAHANPEHGNPAGEVPDRIDADPGVYFRGAGSGTDDELGGIEGDELVEGDLVVAVHVHCGTFEREILIVVNTIEWSISDRKKVMLNAKGIHA